MRVTAESVVTAVFTVTGDFERIHKEWALGVRSMIYQRSKGHIQAGDLDRFRKIEKNMDEAWGRVAVFDRQIFIDKSGKGIAITRASV